jgi:hypothetical protein
MTPEEVKQSITGWCSTDDDLSYTGDVSEPSTDFAVGIRAGGASGGPVEVKVLQGQGADRITVRHVASVAAGSADAAQELLDSRPGWLEGTIERGASGTSVTAQTFVYLDGLNKHTFVQAVDEVAHTGRLLGALSTSAAKAAVAETPVAAAVAAAPVPTYQAPVPVPQPVAAQVPVAQPMAAPSFAPQPQVQQAIPPQPAPGPSPWVPTHSVPAQGLRAWQAPDPSGPVVANLAPGLPIQVSEVRGAWARVICSNGWTGWIDGRLIGVAA